MPLSAEELNVIRSWVGDEPTTVELQEIYDETGDYDQVVRRTLRRKLALLTESPASLSVPGLSISNGQNIISLEGLLKRFDNEGGTGLVDGESTGTVLGVVAVPIGRKVPR